MSLRKTYLLSCAAIRLYVLGKLCILFTLMFSGVLLISGADSLTVLRVSLVAMTVILLCFLWTDYLLLISHKAVEDQLFRLNEHKKERFIFKLVLLGRACGRIGRFTYRRLAITIFYARIGRLTGAMDTETHRYMLTAVLEAACERVL